MNTLATLIIVVIAAIILFEVFRHLFIRKLAKIVLILIAFIVVLLLVSSLVKNNEIFQDSKIIQTGAVVADSLRDDLNLDSQASKVKEKINIEETVNHNNLFKD